MKNLLISNINYNLYYADMQISSRLLAANNYANFSWKVKLLDNFFVKSTWESLNNRNIINLKKIN